MTLQAHHSTVEPCDAKLQVALAIASKFVFSIELVPIHTASHSPVNSGAPLENCSWQTLDGGGRVEITLIKLPCAIP